MRQQRSNLLVMILAIVVVILLGIIAYSLLVKPSFNKYVFEKQMETYNQGVSDMVVYIVNEISQKGSTQIPLGNQTYVITGQVQLLQQPQ